MPKIPFRLILLIFLLYGTALSIGCTLNAQVISLTSNSVKSNPILGSVSLTLTGPNQVNLSNAASFRIQGTCDSSKTTSLTAPFNLSIICVNNTFNTIIDLSSTPEGSITLTIASNIVEVKSLIVFKDTVAPLSPSNLSDAQFLSSLASSPNLTWIDGTDTGSGIQKHQVRILKTPGDIVIQDWIDLPSGISVSNLSLIDDADYYFQVKAFDLAGNESLVASSDGWKVDVTPPTTPTNLFDQIAWTSTSSSPLLTWQASTDSGSDVSHYQVSIGSAPGLADISNWNSTSQTEYSISNGLSLMPNNTYYYNVRSYDHSGNTSAVASSSGFKIVPSMPISNKSAVSSNWNSFYRTSDINTICDGSELSRDKCAHGAEKRVIDLPSYTSCTNLKIQDIYDAFYWRCSIPTTHVVFESVKLKEGKGLKDLISKSGEWKSIHAVLFDTGSPVAATTSSKWWTNSILPLPSNDGTGQVTLSTGNRIYYFSADQRTSGYLVNADNLSFVSLNGASLEISASAPNNCSDLGGPGANQINLFCGRDNKFNWYEVDSNESGVHHTTTFNSKFETFNNFTSQKTLESGGSFFRFKDLNLINFYSPTAFTYSYFDNINITNSFISNSPNSANVFTRIQANSYLMSDSPVTSLSSNLFAASISTLNWYWSPRSTLNNIFTLFLLLQAPTFTTLSNIRTVQLIGGNSAPTKLTSMWFKPDGVGCTPINETGFDSSCNQAGGSNATPVAISFIEDLKNKSGDGTSFNDLFTSGATCPSAAHGNKSATNQMTFPITYLVNAYEIIDDELGNENGFCESNESCIYNPNVGAYQGTGDFYANGTCIFQNGTLVGIKLYAYPNN